MNKKIFIVLTVIVLGGLGFGGYYLINLNKNNEITEKKEESKEETNATNYTSKKGQPAVVYTPQKDETVKSPLTVMGKVKGNWSFEGSFPVSLYDANGNLLVRKAARLEGNWMTEELVSFTVNLTFTKPNTASGKLVLEKDNPSGLEANNDSVEIPVNFD